MSTPARQFVVPVEELAAHRDRLYTRATAAELAGRDDVATANRAAARELQETISATRAAGRRITDGPTLLDRATARLLVGLAEDLDDNAARLNSAEGHPSHASSPLLRQKRQHEAERSQAEANRLWYALSVFMEHKGLDYDDLEIEAPIGRARRHGKTTAPG